MTESEIYKELGVLTKSKDRWEENIPYVTSLMASDSVKVKAKALWMLWEMGLAFPQSIKDSVDAVAAFLDSADPLLRERAVNALGRIGRGCFGSIESYWAGLFQFAHDEAPGVRLAFVKPYIDQLRTLSETDPNRVVRIHSLGAIKAATS